MSPSIYLARLERRCEFIALMLSAADKTREASALFPRKHRLNPVDADHPAPFVQEGTYPLLLLAQEALSAALEINQKAIPIPQDHECLPLLSEPLRQAAEESMERAIQRRLDSEQYSLRRHGLEEPQETHPNTGGAEDSNPESTESVRSDDCRLP